MFAFSFPVLFCFLHIYLFFGHLKLSTFLTSRLNLFNFYTQLTNQSVEVLSGIVITVSNDTTSNSLFQIFNPHLFHSILISLYDMFFFSSLRMSIKTTLLQFFLLCHSLNCFLCIVSIQSFLILCLSSGGPFINGHRLNSQPKPKNVRIVTKQPK